MISSNRTAGDGRNIARIGWTLSALVGLFLIVDAGIKLLRLPVVLEVTSGLGWPTSSVAPLGVILVISTLLYLFPRTSLIGAILLTGYLGGAIATHARIGSPLFTHTLFGTYIGVLMWSGLVLRDPKIRSVLLSR
jgi:hypothetical protein